MAVLAYHAVFTAYGFWLPNDPRGSWSSWVRSWELFLAGGPATKTETRRSVAGLPHDRDARETAKESLRYPPVVFDGHQALSIAHGFASVIEKLQYRVYACSILPTHVHMVLGRYQYKVETMVRLLKAEATAQLSRDQRHPLAAYPDDDGSLPSPWTRKCWKVFLNSMDDVRAAVQYVEQNPIKDGKRRQRWPFVIPYV